MTRTVSLLVEQRAFVQAGRLYQMLTGASPAGQLLRNGRFDRQNVYPPLDWQLEGSPDISAEQRPAQGASGGQSLYAHASTDARGRAARQLIFLAPGTYALSAASGPTDAPTPEGLSWQIVCVSEPSLSLLDQEAKPIGSAARRVRTEFRVPPSGCPVQWLTLMIASGDQPGGTEAWVDTVRIEPVGPRG